MYRKILILLMLVGIVYGANFGSSVKNDHISIKENQTAEFSLLVWTADETESTVTLKILSYPEKWSVDLENKSFIISRNHGNEMVYASEYVHATAVKVFANPNGSGAGKYNILISAIKVPETGSLVMSQERIFNLSVIMEGKPTQVKINIPINEEDITNPNGSSSLNLLAIGLIIFISALIYRYS